MRRSIEINACATLRDYCYRRGRMDDAQRWHERWLEVSDRQHTDQRERTSIRLKDKFSTHYLSANALAKLQQALRAVPDLRRAYLVRKHITRPFDAPIYVLAYGVAGFINYRKHKHIATVLAELQRSVDLPDGTVILSVDGQNYQFARKFFWLRRVKVF